MTEHRETADEYDLKQCGRCAAWIPRTATMCAACGSTSPDKRIDSRPARSPLGLPPYVTATRVLIAVNLTYVVFSVWAQLRVAPRTPLAALLIEGDNFSAGLVRAGWYDHARVVSGEWWRVLAATFLHGGVFHLAVNMYSLHQLGPFAEELFGAAKFLAIYLICGACSALAISVWFVGVQHLPPQHVPPMVGASGAIFGIAGLLTAFLLRRGSARGRAIGMQLAQNLGLMILIGLMIPYISNTGHVGGAGPGILFGLTVREAFSTQLSPESRRNWWLVATLAAVAAIVALGSGIAFTVHNLGAPR